MPLLKWLPVTLAASIGCAYLSFQVPVQAAVNTTNDGQIINGGVYYNTPGSRTTFQNSHGGMLWLKSGSNLRGLESDASGNPTGNGGTVYLHAPGSVVRLDGNIDVSAVKSGNMYAGDGGRLFVDAGYLYQNGNIFANGHEGGMVQFNVGAAVIGPNAKISAQGFGSYGGQILINAKNSVDIAKGAILDASGAVISTYDTGVINIEGPIVNTAGVLRANGVALTDFKTSASDQGIVSQFSYLTDALESADAVASKGGTIRLVAQNSVTNKGTIQANGSQGEREFFIDDDAPGIRGTVPNGGTVILAAGKTVTNHGSIQANGGIGYDSNADTETGVIGGNGGTVVLASLQTVLNTGQITANGGKAQTAGGYNGGNGGLVAYSYDRMIHSGTTQVNGNSGIAGGSGGLVVFSGSANPTGMGRIEAHGGNGMQQAGASGIIVAPNPATFKTMQRVNTFAGANYSQLGSAPAQSAIHQTHRNELLINQDNAILLSQDVGPGTNSASLVGRFSDATIRNLGNPTGGPDSVPNPMGAEDPVSTTALDNALGQIHNVANLIIASPHQQDLVSDLGTSPLTPQFFNMDSLTILNNGHVTNNDAWTPGTHILQFRMGPPEFHDLWMSFGGGHTSILATGDIVNNGFMLNRGMGSAGSMHLYAGRDIVNNLYMLNSAVNMHQMTGFEPSLDYTANHGGFMNLAAGRDISNTAYLNSFKAYYPIHNQNGSLAWPMFLSDAQIGATMQLSAGRNIGNTGTIAADAYTFRHGQAGLDSPANAYGGFITLMARNAVTNTGTVSAVGKSYYNAQPDYTAAQDEVRYMHFGTLPGGTVEAASSNGQIRVIGKNVSKSGISLWGNP